MVFLGTTTVVAFLVSLSSRFLAESFLEARIPIAGSGMGLEFVENAGIAFGIDLPGWLLLILIPVALVLVAHLAWESRGSAVHSLGFGLILGGACANIIDRFDDGLVTDFIQIGWWPLFNVADSCITVGVALLLFYECVLRRGSKS